MCLFRFFSFHMRAWEELFCTGVNSRQRICKLWHQLLLTLDRGKLNYLLLLILFSQGRTNRGGLINQLLSFFFFDSLSQLPHQFFLEWTPEEINFFCIGDWYCHINFFLGSCDGRTGIAIHFHFFQNLLIVFPLLFEAMAEEEVEYILACFELLKTYF